MMYSDFTLELRSALVRYCGLPRDTAAQYTSHGIRAGAATTLVRAQVPDHIIQSRAGVTSADWITAYDRLDLGRRLACSRSLGL